jgi:RimJ/RimL family protein N-acetyltransferase
VFAIEPNLRLEGQIVRLEPLSTSHVEDLSRVALDPAVWEFAPRAVRDVSDLRLYVNEAIELAASGRAVPFAIALRDSGQAIGSTRFGNLDAENRRLEIGWTWIGRTWWRSAVNSECKYLLLSYAFETLGCVRVEFKTDTLNVRSRRAILRLGALEEGTLRRHMQTGSGRWRDTVYYSILDTEWPEVKARLEETMRSYG